MQADPEASAPDPTPTSGNWWEGPPPAGYFGPWPPPLPTGASYGPEFGQIVYGPGSTATTADVVHPDPGWTPPPTPTPTTDVPAPAPTGGGGGGGGTVVGGSTGEFTYTPAPGAWDAQAWEQAMPGFAAPQYQKAPAFVEPDYAAALDDPAYRFEQQQGEQALEQSAAARGVLNTGGTLKDINAWGQNYATQRVNDVRNRARDAYTLNYGTQYKDPYEYAYRSALDAFTGRLQGWQNIGQVGQRQGEIDWQHQYTPYNDLWNRRIQVALA
jgi:hypothetical protein